MFWKLLIFTWATIATDVDLVWRFEKDSGQSSLSALDAGSGKLLAETCGSIIPGDSPIDFSHLESNGQGTFTIGEKSYTVHSNSTYSGGPICNKLFNEAYTLVKCQTVSWSNPADINTNQTDCFSDSSPLALAQMEGHTNIHQRSPPEDQKKRDIRFPQSAEGNRNGKRQYCSPCFGYLDVTIDGDGMFPLY